MTKATIAAPNLLPIGNKGHETKGTETMSDRTSAQMISDGYATPSPEATARADRRRRGLASTYRPDERLDRLLALRDRDPVAYARIADPTTTITLGSYQAAKAAHEEVQHADNS